MSETKYDNYVKAQLYVSMCCQCPKCDEYFDLFEVGGINDEGQLWNLINAKYYCDQNPWENIDLEFQCPECKAELIFDLLEY